MDIHWGADVKLCRKRLGPLTQLFLLDQHGPGRGCAAIDARREDHIMGYGSCDREVPVTIRCLHTEGPVL